MSPFSLGVLGSAHVPAAGGAPIFSDDFNRANGFLGAPWISPYSFDPGAVVVNGNTAKQGGGSSAAVIPDLPTSHFYVTADIIWGAAISSVGLIWHASATSFYYMRINGSGSIACFRGVNNSFTSLATGSTAASPVTFRVEVEASTFRLYVAGSLMATVTDSTLAATTRHGIRLAGPYEAIDNFEVGTI